MQGEWFIRLQVTMPRQAPFVVEQRTLFPSGFIGDYACTKIAQAFVPAIQELIQQVVTHQRFHEALQ